jgi:hypothetical protein
MSQATLSLTDMPDVSEWTRIKPYGPEAYTYWVKGIYKIVCYWPGEYMEYYIPDKYDTWGDNVTERPAKSKTPGNTCWTSLQAAMQACDEHAKTHRPAPKIVRRATELKAELLEKEAQHRK